MTLSPSDRAFLLALVYLGLVGLLLRYILPAQLARVTGRYRRFEQWLETADLSAFFRVADRVSKVAFVLVAGLFVGMILASSVLGGTLYLAR